MERVAGIVLCGGRSSRMGRPKAWLPFGPEVLLQRVVRILSGIVSPVVVVAAPNQNLPTLPGDVIITRDDREHLGPLNGLAAGLAGLEGRADAAYLSSCDVPFLDPAFVRRVIERLENSLACFPEVGGFLQPLAAAYRIDVLPAVRQLLASNRLRPADLKELVPTRILGPADFADIDASLASLRNVNTPQEYEAALRDAGYAPDGPA
jgi:molybdenum cofactor guanylyltransferase